MPPQQPKTSWALPIAILLAFGIIAAVIFFSNLGQSSARQPTAGNTEPSTELTIPVRGLTEYDYVRGNPDAAIMIITYSDYECTDCKTFHSVMNRIISEYGMTGQVAWTMRHMPLQKANTTNQAMEVAIAAECVGNIGGNSSFWKFADVVFSERPVDGNTDLSLLPAYAESAGVQHDEFTSCVRDEAEAQREYITSTAQEAIAAGAIRAPYTVFMVGENQGALNGFQPHLAIKEVVEKILVQIEDQLIDEEFLENL